MTDAELAKRLGGLQRRSAAWLLVGLAGAVSGTVCFFTVKAALLRAIPVSYTHLIMKQRWRHLIASALALALCLSAAACGKSDDTAGDDWRASGADVYKRQLSDPQVWGSAVTNGIFVRFGDVELSHDEILSMAEQEH